MGVVRQEPGCSRRVDAAERGIGETPRFAFAPAGAEPRVADVNGNVAAVLHFLATVMYDPENRITLDPLAADGLCHILDAARHDLLDAAERAGP